MCNLRAVMSQLLILSPHLILLLSFMNYSYCEQEGNPESKCRMKTVFLHACFVWFILSLCAHILFCNESILNAAVRVFDSSSVVTFRRLYVGTQKFEIVAQAEPFQSLKGWWSDPLPLQSWSLYLFSLVGTLIVMILNIVPDTSKGSWFLCYMSKCVWVRYWTPFCSLSATSIWMSVNGEM